MQDHVKGHVLSSGDLRGTRCCLPSPWTTNGIVLPQPTFLSSLYFLLYPFRCFHPSPLLFTQRCDLDSIDILEIALVVSKQYGVQLRADSEENESIFGSLRQLVDYITAHRTK